MRTHFAWQKFPGKIPSERSAGAVGWATYFLFVLGINHIWRHKRMTWKLNHMTSICWYSYWSWLRRLTFLTHFLCTVLVLNFSSWTRYGLKRTEPLDYLNEVFRKPSKTFNPKPKLFVMGIKIIVRNSKSLKLNESQVAKKAPRAQIKRQEATHLFTCRFENRPI